MKKYYDNDMLDEINYLSDGGNFTAALMKLDEYKRLYPEDKVVDITYADILCSQKKYDEAESLLKDVINNKLRNDNIKSRALNLLSTVCYYKGKYEEAKTFILEAIELSNVKFYHQLKLLCDLYTREGDFESAKNVIEKYKNYENQNQLNLILGEVCFYEGSYIESNKVLKRINKNSLSNLELQKYEYFLGKNCYFTKDFEGANEHFKNALSIKNVFYWVSYFYIACIKAKQGKVDDAIRICEEIVKHDKNVLGVEDLLASLYLKKQQPNKSIQIINDIKEDGKKSFNKAKFLLQQGNFIEAEGEAVNAMLNVDGPVKDRARYLCAIIKFKLNKYDEVLDIINNIEKAPDDLRDDILRIKYYITYIKGEAPEPMSYTALQINDYQEDMALSHIYSRHANDFNSSIDITDLFYSVSESFDVNNMDNLKSFDVYRIPMENVGNQNSNFTNVLKVVCIPHSTRILTMFPDDSMENLRDDLNILEEDIKPKKKRVRLSQVDKFNKKYNLS